MSASIFTDRQANKQTMKEADTQVDVEKLASLATKDKKCEWSIPEGRVGSGMSVLGTDSHRIEALLPKRKDPLLSDNQITNHS